MALPYPSHWGFCVVDKAPGKGTDRGTGGPLPLLQAQLFWGRGLRTCWGTDFGEPESSWYLMALSSDSLGLNLCTSQVPPAPPTWSRLVCLMRGMKGLRGVERRHRKVPTKTPGPRDVSHQEGGPCPGSKPRTLSPPHPVLSHLPPHPKAPSPAGTYLPLSPSQSHLGKGRDSWE